MDWQKNVYEENKWAGIGHNPLIENADEIDLQFVDTANQVLSDSVEIIRKLIPSHQSAIAIIIEKDWSTVRKFFSLSEKYAAWKHYAEPAKGFGIHNYILYSTNTIRLTQQELEEHSEWKKFGTQAHAHPPMNGWLATPLLDSHQHNWGLIQLSDKVEGEYNEADELVLQSFARLVGTTLELAWTKRNLLKAQRT